MSYLIIVVVAWSCCIISHAWRSCRESQTGLKPSPSLVSRLPICCAPSLFSSRLLLCGRTHPDPALLRNGPLNAFDWARFGSESVLRNISLFGWWLNDLWTLLMRGLCIAANTLCRGNVGLQMCVELRVQPCRCHPVVLISLVVLLKKSWLKIVVLLTF